MRLLEIGFDEIMAAAKRSGKTLTSAWVAGMWLENLTSGRIDSSGWPTRDAACPEEEC